MSAWEPTEDLWVDNAEGMRQFQHVLLQTYLERVWDSLKDEDAADAVALISQWENVKGILQSLGHDIASIEDADE